MRAKFSSFCVCWVVSLFTSMIFFQSSLRAMEGKDSEGEEVLWKTEIATGYNVGRGNTDEDQLSAKIFLSRQTNHDEWTLGARGYYSAADREMNAQRYGGLIRYAWSFGSRLDWYNFYKIEGDHDRFANIDWRLVPSVGIGYWFFDLPQWKAMVELGMGWESVQFRDETLDRSELVLVPHAFFEKTWGHQLTLSEDLILWPSPTREGEFRLRSETKLVDPIFRRLSLDISVINEYNSDPAEGVERNDLRMVSSLVFSF